MDFSGDKKFATIEILHFLLNAQLRNPSFQGYIRFQIFFQVENYVLAIPEASKAFSIQFK